MPIRFRCVYCDKLLGIARRKAGAVVNCPQCGQPLIVPTPEPEPAKALVGAANQVSPPSPGKLFERDDFDVILQDSATVQAPEHLAANSSRLRKKRKESNLPPRPFPVENSLPSLATPPMPAFPPPRPRPKGVVLTTGMLIGAVVFVLVMLLAAFGGGVLVGRMLATGGNA